MTIQSKVRRMQMRMNEMRQTCTGQKRHCFSLLHDAVLFTGSRIDELSTDSLVGYIELAAMTVSYKDVDFLTLRKKLIELGFNTAPVN